MERTIYKEQPDRADRAVRPFLYIFGAVGLFLLIFVLPWAEGGDELGSEWRTVLALVVFFLGISIFGLLVQLGKPGRLELDEEGLGYRVQFEQAPRRWPWHQLSAFTLHHGKWGDFIVFDAPADERVRPSEKRERALPDDRIEVRIRDRFGEPLDQLVTRLNRLRTAALGAAGKAPADRGAATLAPPGSTQFRADAERDLYANFWFAAAMTSLALAAWFEPLAVKLFFLVLGPSLFAVSFTTRRVFPTQPPRDNLLRLDAQGLTRIRDGESRSWSWQDLEEITLHDARPIWLRPFGHFMTLGVPDDEGEPPIVRRLCRWWLRRPAVMIADIYLVPLGEIAAKMKAYKDRA